MRTAIKWGGLLGTAVVVWTLVIRVLGFYTTRVVAGQRADAVAIVVSVAAIVLALRERKKQGSLPFVIGALAGAVMRPPIPNAAT